ncbi:hypothetical protein ACFSJU_16200 [Paradesertivirga mongoliensis]|uniref:Uncharacterized protein n=1 Tax=Paradesertivirga mongoliensis TaxID=2100740 RepID=A0ABW4ZQ08_9SPHI|nr:hypothetical protein [Pedobacter mongoliensis]
MKSALLFTFSFLIAAWLQVEPSVAQSKKSVYVAKVYTMDNKVVRGILNSADDKGLYLVRRLGDSAQFVNAAAIKEIKLRRKSKTNTGTTIGFLAGIAAGTGMVIALHNDDRLENTLRVVGGVLLTFTTTAIAGAISSHPDEVVHINGRTEDYLQSLSLIRSFTTDAGR